MGEQNLSSRVLVSGEPRLSAGLQLLGDLQDSDKVLGLGETPAVGVDSDRLLATNRVEGVLPTWPTTNHLAALVRTTNQLTSLEAATPQNHHLSVNGDKNLQRKIFNLNKKYFIILFLLFNHVYTI